MCSGMRSAARYAADSGGSEIPSCRAIAGGRATAFCAAACSYGAGSDAAASPHGRRREVRGRWFGTAGRRIWGRDLFIFFIFIFAICEARDG